MPWTIRSDYKLSDSDSIPLITNIQTSQATEVYITLTAHYLDSTWNTQEFLLEISCFPE